MSTLRRPQIESIANIYNCTIPFWYGNLRVKCGEKSEEIGEWYMVQHWSAQQWKEAFERVSGKSLSQKWMETKP